MLPEYSRTERLLDGALHVVGVAASLIATAALLGSAAPTRDTLAIASAAVYAAGLVATFALSAVYNLAVRPGWKEAVRPYDHAAIFLMIAGTYTPLALIGIGGRLGDALLAAVWTIAIAGLTVKLRWPRRYERASIVLYLALGWLGLPAVGPLVAAQPAAVVALIGAGAVLYTIGVAFHAWKSLPQHNTLWHALVLAAAACHYVAVFDVVVGT